MGDFMILGRRADTLRMRQSPSVTVKMQVPSYGEIALDVPADDADEARAVVIEWLAGDEGDGDWRTIQATIDGQSKMITFKASWVAGFAISTRRK